VRPLQYAHVVDYTTAISKRRRVAIGTSPQKRFVSPKFPQVCGRSDWVKLRRCLESGIRVAKRSNIFSLLPNNDREGDKDSHSGKLSLSSFAVVYPLSQSERDQLVNDLSTNAKTRAQVVRAVAEDADLASAEFNRAFVLMQYFGYLRRNPNDPQDADYTGYDFWLTKLNQFTGNYINAEMVKAFITSISPEIWASHFDSGSK
jgi:hypothetical protein